MASKAFFAEEIVPVEARDAKRKPFTFEADEHPRADTTLEGPSRLGVGRLFTISASVTGLVSFACPAGSKSSDCSPPPGRGAWPSPSRTLALRAASRLP